VLPAPYIIVDKVSYLVYCAFFVVLFFYGILSMTAYLRTAHGAERSRIISYCVGIAWMSIPGFVTNLILPYFGNYSLIWVGPLASVPFLITVSRAIIKHGLFDVRLALARTLAYIFTLGVIAVLYVFGVYVLSELLFSQSSLPQLLLNAGVTVALVLVFQPVKHFFDKVTNSLFYRNRYSRDEFYSRLNQILTRSIELQPMLKQSAQLMSETFGAEQVFFVIPDGSRILNIGAKNHTRVARADFDWMTEWWQQNGSEMVLRAEPDGVESGDPRMRRLLRSYGAQMALFLRQSDRVQGILLVGDRRSGRYTPRDFIVLETVADELALAIQNAMSLREVQLLNDTLQQRIDEATKELRASNAQLRRLDEAKDEFISMASHQLRTPLTSIKGYVDMMLEGDAGKVTPMQKRFLTEAFLSSERMVHLINDFLNVSRLQTGKFIIDKRPTDIAKVVKQEVESLHINASGHDLSFQLKVGKTVPKLVMLDEAKIRQVIMNFSDNAIYYSKPGTVIKVLLDVVDDELVLTVKDTGIGVPEAEQANLFSKFFRATNARKQRPDGTGVGLYLAKRVVAGHGGSIIFSSKEGKGSTFGFSVPLKRLRVDDKANKLEYKPGNN
jgi:signal transduction histidine kinase